MLTCGDAEMLRVGELQTPDMDGKRRSCKRPLLNLNLGSQGQSPQLATAQQEGKAYEQPLLP